MSNEMVVGSIRSTTNPPLTGGIYEALLEKAERERDEVRVSLDRLATIASEAFGPFPVQSAEENLTAIESGIHGLRMDNDTLERERDEAQKENKRLEVFASNIHAELMESRKENKEQARLLGMGGNREARLITERDHYKQALEEISTTIQEYKDSMVQEPAEDFIHAIKAWADKKLNNL